jgi:hypothetical protein
VPVLSATDLLASAQRVPGVVKSFAATGTTRSLGRTPSRPELIDAPHYVFEVDLQFPDLAPTCGPAGLRDRGALRSGIFNPAPIAKERAHE